jgi:hypothetical protein
MCFDEVRKKGAFFYAKSQRQNASVTIRPGALSIGPSICFHVTASDQNSFNKQLEDMASNFT